MSTGSAAPVLHNQPHYDERVDLTCAFRWTARLDMHEGVANHFSLAVNDDGSQFLINPCGRHFTRVKASELILCDVNDPSIMDRPDAPDPTAWGLHGSMHRHCPQARCVLHVHSKYATVLASLEDSSIPPIDQNTAAFYNRTVVDDGYGGLAFGDEGARCADLLGDKRVMIMGNHGIMVVGQTVAKAFDELYLFERACRTLIMAYMTGKPLRVLSDEIAEKTASEIENYPTDMAGQHFKELRDILDEEEPDYRR